MQSPSGLATISDLEPGRLVTRRAGEARVDEPIRILILEDSPADAELLQRDILKGGIWCVSRVVETREDFLRGLSDFAPDIILCDNELPHFDGSTALRLARETRPGAPFILATGSISDEAAAAMLASG